MKREGRHEKETCDTDHDCNSGLEEMSQRREEAKVFYANALRM
jgi:hypothetical protein